MTTKITEQNISNLANIGVQWQAVFTGDGSTGLTTVAGRGYFIDTTSGTVTVTLPASPSAGDVVVLKDYARTWGTNAVSIASAKFDGVAAETPSFSTEGQTVTLVYMDGTKGWSLINEDTTSSLGAVFISATGGTVTESGDFKIHTFTGDGCFVVSCAGNDAGSNSVDYLVVAGGGGGGGEGGGGGAGGYREAKTGNNGCYTASPLATPTGIPLAAQTYPITVGGGGTGSTSPSAVGTSGSNSVFSTITSTGGGFGGSKNAPAPQYVGGPGGSGGGVGRDRNLSAGTGNTPPVSPPQGNPGGSTPTSSGSAGGGGGGAGATGSNASNPGPSETGGPGGIGVGTQINTSPCVGTPGPSGPLRYFAGGGGGSSLVNSGPLFGTGGAGGGGNAEHTSSSAGTTNTGGGAGGYGNSSSGTAGNGGSGIVIIRYKFQ